MRTWLAAIALLLCTSAGAAPEPLSAPPAGERPRDQFGYPLDYLDKVEIRNRLGARDYAWLEETLSGVQAAFERDFREERRVAYAFEAFDRLDEETARAVTDWPRHHPDSWVAHLALGVHWRSEAWRARGTGYASETRGSQFERMREHFVQADEALRRALELNPGLVHALEIYIDIGTASSDEALRRRALARALEIQPLVFGAPYSYIVGHTRRWGGSYELVDELARAAQGPVEQNPRLALLLGMGDWDRGADEETCAAAVPLYESALRHGEHWRPLSRRAHCQADPALAIADWTRALELRGPQTWLLEHRAQDFARARAWDRALADIALARALDPFDDDLIQLTYRYRSQREYAEYQENPTFRETLAWGAGRMLHYIRTGWYAFALLGLWLVLRLRAAARGDEQATRQLEIDPARPIGQRIWALYAWLVVLWHVCVYAFNWPTMADADRVDVVITSVGLVGLLGYAHRRRIVSPRLWMIWALVLPGWNLVYDFGIERLGLVHWPLWGQVYLMMLPTFAALFLYGYRSKELWGDPEAVPLVHRVP